MIIDQDTYLEHVGVKGMKWGVRKARDTSDSKSSEQKPGMSKGKKAAIILGSVAVAAGIAAGAVYAKKHFGVSTSDIPSAKETTTKFAKSLANEPVGIAHSSRGRNRGYAFLRGGGMKNLDEEFGSVFGSGKPAGFFARFGDNNEKVAATIADPLGRRDASSRPILHDIILPASMSRGVNSAEDVSRTAWDSIRDLFGAYYESEQGTHGPGF